MIEREIARLPPDSLVLEAAVGLGQLAQRIAGAGLRVVGIDSSFEAALFARRTAEIPVLVGDLTNLPFAAATFGGVTSGETLEHLDDDRAAASEIGRVLAPGGRVVVTVPALEILWSASDDYSEHRRRYTRAELANLFRNAGFDVEKAAFWGFPVVLVYDALFILPMNRRRSRRPTDDDAALRGIAKLGRRRWLVRAVRALFAIDRLFAFLPFGPGLLLVAHRRGGPPLPRAEAPAP